MGILNELLGLPGVVAAGEYSLRGDRCTYRGRLSEEQARMATVLCRSASLGVSMQVDILDLFSGDCGLHPGQGWIVQGRRQSVCGFRNLFCFLEHGPDASVNRVLSTMRGYSLEPA